MMFSRMFMDLKRLVGERERTIMWIENAQNEDSLKFLSFKSLHYQQVNKNSSLNQLNFM